jgi:hypothetical protein
MRIGKLRVEIGHKVFLETWTVMILHDIHDVMSKLMRPLG